MNELLAQLICDRPLSTPQAIDAFEQIMADRVNVAQMAALLALIQRRGATVEEITGAATVMRRHVTPVAVPDHLTVIDTCGTGGDHASTFNISTAAAIVAAAAGRPRHVAVAKHGNRAVTSKSGSSQVLETLGVKLRVAPATLTRCLDEAGLCFCFAPAHHPAMKHAAPVRADLGFRTIFNVLGPLTNPAAARRQVIGVFSESLTETIASVLQKLGTEQAMVVCGRHGDGALDELSTTGPTRVSHLRHDRIETSQIDPASLGLAAAAGDDLTADSAERSAEIIRQILGGRNGAARDIVLLNTAAALVVADLADGLLDGLEVAAEAIDSGAAAACLEKLVTLTQADETG
jgi:anthranilate phosphoribosyltransferase